ncbi:FAD-binding oxidoreductase [Brackiella oedipodis]|uniref:FAD-binding oxidoreductase n=1 Tax=Brackiella oedipodis TaxID=124225 RepID=UPI00048F080E|nr:FAD-binding oxidoreductase [Brackiella oedipodis]
MSLLHELESIVGPEHVLQGESAEPYLTDWRHRYSGKCLAVVRPANSQEIAEVVSACFNYQIPIVPQGGNTGLCGGATPSNKGDAVVLSTMRLNQILNIDTDNNTITVQAGCILQTIQEAARQAGRLFPLSLAAQGSCSIGGNLATNAGGTQVLRYGNTRELTLGLEVVTAEGDIWNGLRSLRKDNTGYDLRDLYIGSEGTLGIITAATLKLYPLPAGTCTALLAFESIDAAVQVLNRASYGFGASLTAFELMSDYCLQRVVDCFGLPVPFALQSPWYALLEISDAESEQHARELFEKVVGQAMEDGLVIDAAIAESLQQSHDLWHLRESIPLAEAKTGQGIKNDISIPISEIARFVKDTNALLQQHFPGVRHIVFGHLGDGNLHYNIGAPIGQEQGFLENQKAAFKVVYDQVAAFNGSISAEHGIGQLKKSILPDYKDEVEIALMRRIKRALDPYGLMNPGKVISSVDFEY